MLTDGESLRLIIGFVLMFVARGLIRSIWRIRSDEADEPAADDRRRAAHGF